MENGKDDERAVESRVHAWVGNTVGNQIPLLIN